MNTSRVVMIAVLLAAGGSCAGRAEEPDASAAGAVEESAIVSPAAADDTPAAPAPVAKKKTKRARKESPPVEADPVEQTLPAAMSTPPGSGSGVVTNDLQAGLMLGLPLSSDWDLAIGLEAKARHWWENNWGVGAAIGYDLFNYPSSSLHLTPTTVTPFTAKGDASLIPLTLLGSRRYELNPTRQVIVEGGLRFIFVDSQVEVSTRYTDHRRRDVHYTSFVDSQDQFMLVLGGELRNQLEGNTFWLVAGEYQFYLAQPDANWLREDIGNDFSALLFRAGVGRTW